MHNHQHCHHHHHHHTTHAPTRADLAHLLSPSYLPSGSSSSVGKQRIYKDSEGISHDPSFSLFPSEEDYSRRRGSFESSRSKERELGDEDDAYDYEQRVMDRKFGYSLSVPSSPSSPSTSYLPPSPLSSTITTSTPSPKHSPLHRLFSRHHTNTTLYDEDAFWEGDEEEDSDLEEEEETEQSSYQYYYYSDDDEDSEESTGADTIDENNLSQLNQNNSSLPPQSLRRRIQYLQLAVQLGVFRAGRRLKSTRRTLSF